MHPEKVVLASGNKKKLAEITDILSSFQINVVPQSDFQVEDAIEDGLTFVENAIIKARHACQLTGLPAIADDSGIEVDCLNGEPGIYSARYSGENATDASNLSLLLKNIQNVPAAERTARYQCVIVYMKHPADPTPIICQAHWEGVLIDTPRGDGGFGYDPIFLDTQSNKTAAQMMPSEKSAISHRGKALALFREQFTQQYQS